MTLARVHEKGTSMTVIHRCRPAQVDHTAVAIDRDERPLARVQLVADRCQVQRLVAWAEPLGPPGGQPGTTFQSSVAG